MTTLPRSTRIDDPAARRIFETITFVTGMAVALINDPTRRGLYAFVGIAKNDQEVQPFFHEPIGIVPADRAEKYMKFSAEKPCRAYRLGDVTSYTSRDPDNGQWGGGIVAGGQPWLIGVSGLPEQWDEAVVVVTTVLSELESADWAARISAANANGYIMSLLLNLDLVAHDRV